MPVDWGPAYSVEYTVQGRWMVRECEREKEEGGVEERGGEERCWRVDP